MIYDGIIIQNSLIESGQFSKGQLALRLIRDPDTLNPIDGYARSRGTCNEMGSAAPDYAGHCTLMMSIY